MPTLPYRRILVTGADGFVGRHLLPAIESLLLPGARVVEASREAVSDEAHVRLDLTDAASVRDAIAAVMPDAIVHLAAQSSVALARNAAAETWRVNAGGTLALASAVAQLSPDAVFLFASSAEVYGATFNEGIATEESPLRPTSPYARSKAAAEALLTDVLPPDTRLIVARPGNHSGGGQTSTFVLPSFAEQIAIAETADAGTILVGQLDTQRDFLDVADVVDAYLILLAQARSFPTRYVVNISSGHSPRIGDLLDALLAMAKSPITVMSDPSRLRPSEVPVAAIDNNRMAALGWRPTIPLADTLAALLHHQRAQLGVKP